MTVVTEEIGLLETTGNIPLEVTGHTYTVGNMTVKQGDPQQGHPVDL